jgi:hypothetical protein
VSHHRHDIWIGALRMEVIRQTRPDPLTEQMAEQKDSAAAQADLEQSGSFGLDPHNLVTYGFEHSLARSGQLRFGTDMQDGSGASHEALMSFKDEGWFSFRFPVGGCDTSLSPYSETKSLP